MFGAKIVIDRFAVYSLRPVQLCQLAAACWLKEPRHRRPVQLGVHLLFF